jgi:hypothetical protein
MWHSPVIMADLLCKNGAWTADLEGRQKLERWKEGSCQGEQRRHSGVPKQKASSHAGRGQEAAAAEVEAFVFVLQ